MIDRNLEYYIQLYSVLFQKEVIFIKYDKEKIRKNLLDNGFVKWRWGKEDDSDKLEGHLDNYKCSDLIGLKEDCFVAVILNINEARFATEKNFENKVRGHEKQLKMERIIFGEDKNKLFKNGDLILFETIISLDKLVDYFKNGK